MLERTPIDKWGSDHWSTLAYIETVVVDCQGFHVGYDPRMRTMRRNYRLLLDQGNAKRATKTVASAFNPRPILGTEYPTRLKGGVLLERHDDWDCVIDMIAAGIFTFQDVDEDPPLGKTLVFSKKGRTIANELRDHKARGGKFAEFDPTIALARLEREGS